jgi:hypothetical protein
MAAPAKPRIWKKCLIAAASTLAACIAVECGVRLYFGFASGFASTDGSNVTTGNISQYDPVMGFRLAPGSTARSRSPEFDITIRVNGQGLRMDRDVPYAKDPAKRRIALFGDSFTFGYGVDTGDRFGETMERSLPGVEVVNCGIWATGTDQQYLFYREEGHRYSPDLVVLCYLVENIVRNAHGTFQQSLAERVYKPQFVIKDGALALTNVPVPRGVVPWTEEQTAAEENRGTGFRFPLKNWLRDHSAAYAFMKNRLGGLLRTAAKANSNPYPEYSEGHPAYEVTKGIIKQFRDDARSHGSAFALVIVPTQPFVANKQIDTTPFRMIEDFCRKEEIPACNLLAPLRAVPQKLYYTYDQHWNAAGHRAAGAEIARYLKEKLGY